jgi:hypothetical protein
MNLIRCHGAVAGLSSTNQSYPPLDQNLPPEVNSGTIFTLNLPYQPTQDFPAYSVNPQSTFSAPDIMPFSIATAPAASHWSNVPLLRQPPQYIEQQGDPYYHGPRVNPAFDATYDPFANLTQAPGQSPWDSPADLALIDSTLVGGQGYMATMSQPGASGGFSFDNTTENPSFFQEGTQAESYPWMT